MGFFSSVGNWFKGAANTVHNAVLKPIYNSVLKPVYEKAIVPIYNTGASVVRSVATRVEQVADIGIGVVKGQANALNSFTNMLSNPIIMIGGLVIGGIVLSKLLDSKR